MPDHLGKLARQRSSECLRAVRSAVHEMQARGDDITIKSVSREAGVSRNFIYTTPEAFELVSSFRGMPRTRGARTAPAPAASDASLLSRLAAALSTIDELREAVARLEARNQALLVEVIALQNPSSPNVTPIMRRRM